MFKNNEIYLIKQSVENEIERIENHIESLSIDDFENNGHNLENDIIDLHNILEKLDNQ